MFDFARCPTVVSGFFGHIATGQSVLLPALSLLLLWSSARREEHTFISDQRGIYTQTAETREVSYVEASPTRQKREMENKMVGDFGGGRDGEVAFYSCPRPYAHAMIRGFQFNLSTGTYMFSRDAAWNIIRVEQEVHTPC